MASRSHLSEHLLDVGVDTNDKRGTFDRQGEGLIAVRRRHDVGFARSRAGIFPVHLVDASLDANNLAIL